MQKKSPWGDQETKFFYELTPHAILDSVEECLQTRTTGRLMALNSLENRVYDIELEDDDGTHVIAKFYRPCRWTKEQIIEEHQFLNDLHSAEINVVRPLTLHNGSSIASTKNSNLLMAIFPKVRGRAPDEVNPEMLRELGRLIARVHTIGSNRKANHRLKLTPETYGQINLDYLLSANMLPPQLVKEFSGTVENILQLATPLFQDLAEPEMIRIHGDCHLGNLIQTATGMCVVDFDDMVVGPPVQDLWLLLPGAPAEDLEQVLNGYESMRKFDRRSLKLITPLRALRMIHFSAWLAKRWQDPSFPRAFPQFNTTEYWQSLLRDLQVAEQAIRRNY